MSETNSSLQNKIDFAVIISVEHANPNGDPLNGNRPRQTYDSIGEISDVCLKRKLRNRLLDLKQAIFVQSDDKRNDSCRSLKARLDESKILKNADFAENVNKKWFDVRAFGQVFAFKENSKSKTSKTKSKEAEDQGQPGNNPDDENDNAISIGIRGPVTIQSAFSLESITTESIQITKSVNLETDKENPEKKASDTMGMKHRVTKGIYVTYGSINPQLASVTHFSEEDSEVLLKALCSMFENDVSAARPEGSMEVLKVVWWKHNCFSGQYSSAKVHRTLKENIRKDGTFDEKTVREALPGLVPTFYDQLEGKDLQ